VIVTHTLRGVTYSARILPHGKVELRASGEVVTTGELTVRIESPAVLGGDEQSAMAIYSALEQALEDALARDP
jgi:hypothetical protein